MGTEREEQQTQNRGFLARVRSLAAEITLAGLFLSALSIGVTIYVADARQEPEPGVTFETISEINVLDVQRPLKDLDIFFRGQDLREQNYDLRILIISVVNSGGVNIRYGDYDPNDDWGMRFNGGEVVKVTLLDATTEHLRSNANPQILSADAIKLPRITFDKDDIFVIEVLLLHPKNASPSISAIGKISGVDEIQVLTRPLAGEEVSFFSELFSGSIGIILVRAIIYSIGSMLAFIAIILALVGVTILVGNLRSWWRKNRILQTRAILQIDDAEIRDLLIQRYESSGASGLRSLQEFVQEPGKLMWVTPPSEWMFRAHREFIDSTNAYSHRYMGLEIINSSDMLRVLMEADVLERGEEDNAIIDPKFGEMIDNLLQELDN